MVNDPPPPPAPPPSPGGNAAGCALFAIGMLMLIPSGLCTAFGGFGLIAQLFDDPKQLIENLPDILPFVLITIIPLGFGIVLVRLGLRSRKDP
jgi:amino acid transporter